MENIANLDNFYMLYWNEKKAFAFYFLAPLSCR